MGARMAPRGIAKWADHELRRILLIPFKCPTAELKTTARRPRSEQPFAARFDRADDMGVARFANVGHINEPVRERNWLPFHSLHRLITAGTHHDWSLCFRSEHRPVPLNNFRWRNVSVRWLMALINRPRHDPEMGKNQLFVMASTSAWTADRQVGLKGNLRP